MGDALFITTFDGYKIIYHEKSCKIIDPFGHTIRTPTWSVSSDFTLYFTDFNQQWSFNDRKIMGTVDQKIWNTFKEQYATYLLEKSMKQG